MKLKQLFTDDDAVSPVIGVILMVAITVILAAVIGAFVLNIGGSQDTAPSVSFDFDNSPTDAVEVTVQSASESVPNANWGINGHYPDDDDPRSNYIDTGPITKDLSSGTTFVVTENSFDITWKSSGTDKTAILGSYEA